MKSFVGLAKEMEAAMRSLEDAQTGQHPATQPVVVVVRVEVKK